MAIVLTGTKTVNRDVSPTHTAAAITTKFATALENLTYGDLMFMVHACQGRQGGLENSATMTSLFS